MSWNEPGGDDKDPWSGRGDQQKGPPDLDQAIRSLQEKLSKFFGGGAGNGGGGDKGTSLGSMRSLGYILLGLVVLWVASGFYIVDQGKRGVVTRFGKFVETTEPGPNWHFPVPIEQVEIVNIEQNRTINVGFSSFGDASRPEPKEALMLTKDENYVDVRLVVQYQVKDAKDFLFNVVDPAKTLKQVTESAERGVIGASNMDFVLTEGRSEVVAMVKKEIQSMMDTYNAGIHIITVNLRDAQPPEQVQNAFEDVIKAREDEQRLINEAQGYANDVVPKARGAAARKLQEAEGYKEQVIAEAEGETSRFSKLVAEYIKAPEITRKRLYLEAIESVLTEANTVMVDVKGGNNLLYLPLDKLVQSMPSPDINATSSSDASDQPSKPVSTEQTSMRNSVRGRSPRGR